MTQNKNFSQFSTEESDEFSYTGTTDRGREGHYYSLNSNYSHTFGPNEHQLLAELFFSRQNSDENTVTSEFNNQTQISGVKTTEFSPSTDFRGKLDYTLTLSEFSNFEAGYQGSVEISEETNELYDFNPETGEMEFQSEYSDLNKYNESEHAIYSLYSNKIRELKFQIGVRSEYTYRTIEIPTQNQSFKL
jgi:hypothetical protein